MATLDPSIALGVKPVQIESPLNQLAQIAQLQGAQGQNALLALKMDEARRGVEETNAMNDLWRTAVRPDGTVDTNALYTGAASRGLGSKVPALQKTLSEAEEARGKLAKQKVELVDAKLKQRRSVLDMVNDPQGFIQWHQGNHADPVLGPELAAMGITPEKSLATIQQELSQPGGFERLKQKAALGLEEYIKQNKPTIHMQDTGGASNVVSTPGLGGPPTVLSSTPITQSANNRATVAASLENAAATRAAAKTTAQATRDAANIQTGFKNEQDLRKEFEALPEVKKYKQALPAYKGIEDAVKRNTTQSDINIVYGLAKIYDPESVVREGEYATVANSPNIPERVKGYAQYLAGGGKLTAETKRQILDEARSRMKSFEDQYGGARGDFESIAKRSNIDPTKLFPRPTQQPTAAPAGVPAMSEIDAELERRRGRAGK
jgi:hypothetical protein